MKIGKGIGERIRARRLELNLTQRDLAEYLGRSASAVTQWENESTYPNGQNLVRLAEILKTDAEWILSGEHSVFQHEEGDFDSWTTAGALPSPIFTLEEASQVNDKFDYLLSSQTHKHVLTYTGGDYTFVLKAEDRFTPKNSRVPMPEGALLVIDCDRETKSEITHGKFVLVVNSKANSSAVIREIIHDGASMYLAPPTDGLPAYELNSEWRVIGVLRQIIIDV